MCVSCQALYRLPPALSNQSIFNATAISSQSHSSFACRVASVTSLSVPDSESLPMRMSGLGTKKSSGHKKRSIHLLSASSRHQQPKLRTRRSLSEPPNTIFSPLLHIGCVEISTRQITRSGRCDRRRIPRLPENSERPSSLWYLPLLWESFRFPQQRNPTK